LSGGLISHFFVFAAVEEILQLNQEEQQLTKFLPGGSKSYLKLLYLNSPEIFLIKI
jgi:hypothetical protein